MSSADPPQPPRQAAPDTPPREGNCLVQTLQNHPVRLRLPPLHRRGMIRPYQHRKFGCNERTTPSSFAPATPPEEGNVRSLAAAFAEAFYHAKLGDDFGKFSHCFGSVYISELAL